MLTVLIKCGSCGFLAGEMEFSPNGTPGEQLACPQCGEQSALSDYDE